MNSVEENPEVENGVIFYSFVIPEDIITGGDYTVVIEAFRSKVFERKFRILDYKEETLFISAEFDKMGYTPDGVVNVEVLVRRPDGK